MKLLRKTLGLLTASVVLTGSLTYIEASEHGQKPVIGSELSEELIQRQRGTTDSAITVDTEAPDVTLSQTMQDGNYYLVINATDNGWIDTVTVNDTEISFDEHGGIKKYPVSKSGEYVVTVKDSDGNETTESYYVNMNATNPKLKLSKIYKDKKWYLSIKVEPTNDNRISRIIVNDRDTAYDFDTRGDEITSKITSTATYKVVVIDDLGMESSDSIEIDVKDIPDSEYPVLSLSQSSSENSSYLVITATDNGRIAKVTVNEKEVAMPANGNTIRQVVEPGCYKVIVTDNDGNKTRDEINITAPGVSNEKKEVKFTLSSKEWSINGMKQAAMDIAPINKNGRIYLPLRFTAYALDIDSKKISWDEKAQTATINDGSNVVKVTAGSKIMLLNGKAMTMEVAAFCENGRVFLPISQVSKAFPGVSLKWDNAAKEVTIVRQK